MSASADSIKGESHQPFLPVVFSRPSFGNAALGVPAPWRRFVLLSGSKCNRTASGNLFLLFLSSLWICQLHATDHWDPDHLRLARMPDFFSLRLTFQSLSSRCFIAVQERASLLLIEQGRSLLLDVAAFVE